MNPFMLLLNELLFRPIFNLLMVFLTFFQGNMGLAIIVLTLAIRFALYKSSASALQMQQSMGSGGDMQKKMEEIQEKYKDDPQQQAKEMMNLLKKGGAGPLKGCKAMLLQFPIFIGLYGVISNFANYGKAEATEARLSFNIPYSEQIYSFLHTFAQQYLDPTSGTLETLFFGVDLFAKGSIVLAVLTVVLMAANMKLTTFVKPPTPAKASTLPNGQAMPDMQKMMMPMMYFMSVFMGMITYSLASGIGLYMVVTSLFSVGQSARTYRTVLHAKRDAWKNKGKGVVVSKKD